MCDSPVWCRVEELLLQHATPESLPVGLFAYVAREVGCSRDYVSRVARALGLPTRSSRATAVRFGCGSCGAPITRFQATRSGLCRPCRQVVLPCESCGKPVTRDIWVFRHTGRSESPRLFCDRVCFGRWVGRQNRGRTAMGTARRPLT